MVDIAGKKAKGPSTQQFVPIKEIRENIVVMRDGSLRSVIMISSINFALKGDEEKNSIIASYQGFLNSLGFPVQIYIKSRKLHLDKYLNDLDQRVANQTNELLKLQTQKYAEFIEELLDYASIMEKRFFLIVPFFPSGIGPGSKNPIEGIMGNKKSGVIDSNFETKKLELVERVDRVVSGLSGIGVRCATLNTEELIELFYTIYNPETSGNEVITDAENLESAIITSAGGPNAR
jgi:type IV secretory pathway VirB4 component